MLLTLAITVTTILVVVTGLQLIITLKEIRQAIKKIGSDALVQNKKTHKPDRPKNSQKKPTSLIGIIGRIRTLLPAPTEKNKKFFIKE